MAHPQDPTRELTPQSAAVGFAATVGLITSAPVIVSAPSGLLLEPVTRAFGIGHSQFALAIAIASLGGAFIMPLAGRVMDRRGVRAVVLPGMVLFSLATMLISQVPISFWALLLALTLQGALSATVGTPSYTRIISLWFHKRRGAMLAVCSAIGMGGGSAIASQLAGHAISHGGWRTAYLWLGIYILVIGLPILLLLLREPPNLQPEGKATLQATNLPGFTRAEALRDNAFRFVLLAVFLTMGPLVSIMFNGPAMLAERGLNIGANFLAASALGSLFGQLLSGPLLDRVNSPKVAIPFAAAAFFGSIIVLYLGTSAKIILPAAFIMGLGQGAEVGFAAYFISRYCGLKAFAEIFGVMASMMLIMSGFFPILIGLVHDATGSYAPAMPVLVLMMLGSVITLWFLPSYRFNVKPDSFAH